MYSDHDTTIASFLDTLDMYKPHNPPPYASMVLVEVFHDRNNQKLEVRFLYRNCTPPANIDDVSTYPQYECLIGEDDTTLEVKYLRGKCGEFCSLVDFDTLTSDLRAQDWKSECNYSPDSIMHVIMMWYLIVMVCIFHILLIIGILAWFERRKVSEEKYNYLFTIEDFDVPRSRSKGKAFHHTK